MVTMAELWWRVPFPHRLLEFVVVIEVEGTAQSSDRNYFTVRYRPPALHSRRVVGNASPVWTCLRVPEIPPQPIAGTVAL